MKILSLSSFVPEAICDIVRFTQYKGERNIPLYCGYAADFISQVQYDTSVDGAVFPKTCDSSRSIKSYIDTAGDKFVYELTIPARQDELAVSYFARVLRDYRDALEKFFKISTSDDEIRERMRLLNKRNDKIRRLYGNLNEIKYSGYLKNIHSMLQLPLQEQCGHCLECDATDTGKPVYLVGSFLSNLAIVEAIENAGLQVVGDNLPESGRLVSTHDYVETEDVFGELARVQLSVRLSPTQNNFREILNRDLAEIEKCNAAGVVFVMQKYCEPYQYLYAVYEKELASRGIPFTKIMVADTEDDGKAVLVLETFAGLLGVDA